MGDRVPLAGLKMYPYNVRKKKEKNRGTDKTVRERLSSLFSQFKPRLDLFQNSSSLSPPFLCQKEKEKKLGQTRGLRRIEPKFQKEGIGISVSPQQYPQCFSPGTTINVLYNNEWREEGKGWIENKRGWQRGDVLNSVFSQENEIPFPLPSVYKRIYSPSPWPHLCFIPRAKEQV